MFESKRGKVHYKNCVKNEFYEQLKKKLILVFFHFFGCSLDLITFDAIFTMFITFFLIQTSIGFYTFDYTNLMGQVLVTKVMLQNKKK